MNQAATCWLSARRWLLSFAPHTQDWWDSVKNELEKPSFNKKQMADMYDEMSSSLGDRNTGGHGMFRTKFIKVCGLIFKARKSCIFYKNDWFSFLFFIWQKFAKEVEKLLGSKGSKLFEKRKEKSFVRQVEELAGSMRGFQKEPGNLKEYSPWLSGFKAEAFGNELEIPGQNSHQ